jgi:hypothetical protein
MSFDKYSAMLKCQIWLQYSNIGFIHDIYPVINVSVSAFALFKIRNIYKRLEDFLQYMQRVHST